jgi:hypothetical protein
MAEEQQRADLPSTSPPRLRGMSKLTEEDLEAVDIAQPIDTLARDSPILAENKEQAELLMRHAKDPIALQQVTMAEIRATLVRRMEDDLADCGRISDSTLQWLVKLNQQLSEVHKNLHGTKATQLNMEAKLSHSQLASLIRQAESDIKMVETVASKVVGDNDVDHRQRLGLLEEKYKRTLTTNERQRQDIKFMRTQLQIMRRRITDILKMVKKE